MHHLSRFRVSLEEDLLAAFDQGIAGAGYQNRSEAIRDLIRDHLIQKKVGQGRSTSAHLFDRPAAFGKPVTTRKSQRTARNRVGVNAGSLAIV